MKQILIGSARMEVCKLFEMLLWNPNRNFANANSLDKCLRQLKKLPPELLIIDVTIDTPERCFNVLAALKDASATTKLPIVILSDPQQDCEDRARLLVVADDHISEPFNPDEIKTIVEKYL